MEIKMQEIKIQATGTVAWPPVSEMRQKILDYLSKRGESELTAENIQRGSIKALALMDDAQVLETYKSVVAK